MKVVKQLNSEIGDLHKMKVELNDAREKEANLIQSNNDYVEGLKLEFHSIKSSYKEISESNKVRKFEFHFIILITI